MTEPTRSEWRDWAAGIEKPELFVPIKPLLIGDIVIAIKELDDEMQKLIAAEIFRER